MHLTSISSLALLLYPTSDSPDFAKPLVSPQCFRKLGLGSVLGFSQPKCERLQARAFANSVVDFSSAGPVGHPKPLAFFWSAWSQACQSEIPKWAALCLNPYYFLVYACFCCACTWELGLLPSFHIFGLIIFNLQDQRFLQQVTWLHCFEMLDGMWKDVAAAMNSLFLLVSTKFSLCCITKTAQRWNTAPFPASSLFKTAMAVSWRLTASDL